MPKSKKSDRLEEVKSSPINRASPKKAANRVEEQDKSLWRTSRIKETCQINKTNAKTLYRLNDKDLEGIAMVKSQTVVKVYGVDTIKPMYLYSEREVEMRAWEKYGGPGAFEKMLDMKEARFEAKDSNKYKLFPRPRSYPSGRADLPCVTVLIAPDRTHVPDPETSTPKLIALKHEMCRSGKLWLWDAINKAIGRVYDAIEIMMFEAEVRGPAREAIVESALRYYYPQRSEFSLVESPSFRALQSILNQAPVFRGWEEPSEGIDEDYDGFTGDTSICWNIDYTDKVYAHLIEVINNHGLDGWKQARWLVYDKYVECDIGNLNCWQERGRWYWDDSARFWLDVERPIYGLRSSKTREKYRLRLEDIGANQA